MKFETLLAFVKKGRIKPHSVVRGPTTHQLWRFAAHVKGLSREFNVCYSCASPISAEVKVCPQCNRLQDPPANPDEFLETSAGAAAAAPAGENRAPVYREIPLPGGERKPITVSGSQAADDAEDSIVTDAGSPDDSDIVIPAIEPDATAVVPAIEESPQEQEIVIPQLTPTPLVEPLPAVGAAKPPIGRREEDLSAPGNGAGRAARPPERTISREDDNDRPRRREPVFGSDRLPPPPGRLPGRDTAGPGPIPAPGPMPRRMPGRSKAGAEVAIFILVIGVALISGLLYVDPELRQQASVWIAKWTNPTDTTTAAPAHAHRPELAPMAATMPSQPEPHEDRPAPAPPISVVPPEVAPVPDSPPPAEATNDHAAPAEPAAPPPAPALSDVAAAKRAEAAVASGPRCRRRRRLQERSRAVRRD